MGVTEKGAELLHATAAHDGGVAKVAIVVLNYNGYLDTMQCLGSLGRASYKNMETIVVDNASTDSSFEQIHRYLSNLGIAHVCVDENAIGQCKDLPQRVFLVQASENRGYAAGNNVGIRLAVQRRAEYVLILNNDTLVDEAFLEPLVHYADTYERVGAVGPMIIDSDNNITRVCARRRPVAGDFFFRLGIGRKILPNNRWIRRHTYSGEYDFDEPMEVDVLSGACLLLKGSALEKTGLLDENTFLYLEEFILHERLRSVGLTSAVVPASRIVHKEGQTIAKIPSKAAQAAQERSLRYYWTQYRHYPPLVVAALVTLGPRPMELLRRLLNRADFIGDPLV